MKRTPVAAPVEENMAPKKHFVVFCAIFLTVALLLAVGAWRTHAEIETRRASEPREGPRGPAAAPEPPAVRRFANPAGSAAPTAPE